MAPAGTATTLVFDADDTLWENNFLFERVIDDFLDWLDHPTLDRVQIRAVLDDIERANAVSHGYGSKVFLRSLGECLERLRERPVTERERVEIDELAAALLGHQVELMPGVADTLDALAGRYDLLLLTKGDREEQQRKLDVCGLLHHFDAAHIVAEKDVTTYRWLAREHGFAPADAWMIGNSPKSDILPARAAGMRAVFIPNENTWVLEEDDLDPTDAGVVRLAAFPDLLQHF
ncbi:HAD family hydrolase [Micromonospora sp. NPDC092111]|uniref:HAD family hydrolase n=1 Tax=Micromonospora sp. NPDC092111 TaxID=3364289 RepID=UPI0037F7BAE7